MLKDRPYRIDKRKLSVVQDVLNYLLEDNERMYYFNEIITYDLHSEYIELHKVKMANCTFDKAQEINIDNMKDYSYSQFMSDLINNSSLVDYDNDTLKNIFGYSIDNISAIIDWTKEYYHRNIDFEFSDAINCSFDNVNIGYYNRKNSFRNCQFNDCYIMSYISKPYDYNFYNSIFNECTLAMISGWSNRNIDNENIIQIGKNQYNNVFFDLKFSLAIKETDKFIFYADSFDNCSIVTDDKYAFGLDDEELAKLAPCIKFVNCTVNGEKLDGTYIFNDNAIASKNFEIKPENLIKEN